MSAKRWLLILTRWVIPGALITFGIVYGLVTRTEEGAEAFSLFAGAGLSIMLLNFLYRMGVTGDSERDEEDQAREYFSEHGHWPDEKPER